MNVLAAPGTGDEAEGCCTHLATDSRSGKRQEEGTGHLSHKDSPESITK